MKLTTPGDIDKYVPLFAQKNEMYLYQKQKVQNVQSHGEQQECSALHILNGSNQKWRVTFDHIEIFDLQKCLRKHLADYPPTPNQQT